MSWDVYRVSLSHCSGICFLTQDNLTCTQNYWGIAAYSSMKIQLTLKYVLLAGSAEYRFPLPGKVTFSIQFNLCFNSYLSKQRSFRSSRASWRVITRGTTCAITCHHTSHHMCHHKLPPNPKKWTEVALSYGLGKQKSPNNQVLAYETSTVSPQCCAECMHTPSVTEEGWKCTSVQDILHSNNSETG